MTDKKERPAHNAYDIVPAKAADYPMLVDIWEASVRATHTFLAEADLQRLRSRLATDYFPAVELHMLLTDGDLSDSPACRATTSKCSSYIPTFSAADWDGHCSPSPSAKRG